MSEYFINIRDNNHWRGKNESAFDNRSIMLKFEYDM